MNVAKLSSCQSRRLHFTQQLTHLTSTFGSWCNLFHLKIQYNHHFTSVINYNVYWPIRMFQIIIANYQMQRILLKRRSPPEMLFRRIILLVCLSLLGRISLGNGLKCSEHPLYHDALQGALIKSWSYLPNSYNESRFSRSFYVPRDSRISYKLENHRGAILGHLDSFITRFDNSFSHNFLTLRFQRPTTVYILFPSWKNPPSLPWIEGWENVGWASLRNGNSEMLEFGINLKVTIHIPARVYIYKVVISNPEHILQLPSLLWIQEKVNTVANSGKYFLLLSEQDGSPSKIPMGIHGETANAAEKCPTWLHDTWVTPDNDKEDKDTSGILWKTWHPLWDPCFWCTYEHEHGSNAKKLMGYVPKFHYAAWKNHRQDESHGGFKSFVLKSGPYFVYINIHAHLSRPTRYREKMHTVVLAVTDATTKELLMELSVKADFGKLVARKKGGGTITLDDNGEEKDETVDETCIPKRERVVNVINPNSLDERFAYRSAKRLLTGDYEKWITQLPCTRSAPENELTIDIKDPTTGLLSAQSGEQIILGREDPEGFIRNAALDRSVFMRNLRIGDRECQFTLADIGGLRKNGVFYTDQTGKRILLRPGLHAIRQFIKPGFNAIIGDGEYQAVDTWDGIYKANHAGAFRNVAYGVDPDKN